MIERALTAQSSLYLDNRHRLLAFEELYRGTMWISITSPERSNDSPYRRSVVTASLSALAGAEVGRGTAEDPGSAASHRVRRTESQRIRSEPSRLLACT